MHKTSPSAALRQIPATELAKIPCHLIDFLKLLDQPTAITVTGRQPERHRIICTLLHGNEPSGAKAIHRWLSEWQLARIRPPKTNITFLLPNIEASLLEPVFNHRQFPNRRDLNRCFSGPTDDAEGQLAANLLSYIHSAAPEAIIDLHNTSGSGPAFAVGTVLDHKHKALASYFTERLVYTNLKLGALMELGEHFTPTITIECGGAQDEAAHIIAYEGIQRFMCANDIFSGLNDHLPIQVYKHPMRLKLREHCTIAFGTLSENPADLTLRNQAESLNYGPTAKGTTLGWLGKKGLSALLVEAEEGTQTLDNFFEMTSDGKLITRINLQLFMVTPREDIAQSDCICYFSPV